MRTSHSVICFYMTEMTACHCTLATPLTLRFEDVCLIHLSYSCPLTLHLNSASFGCELNTSFKIAVQKKLQKTQSGCLIWCKSMKHLHLRCPSLPLHCSSYYYVIEVVALQMLVDVDCAEAFLHVQKDWHCLYCSFHAALVAHNLWLFMCREL